jgi:hypothetical protein
MPAAMFRFYEAMLARARAPQVARVIRQERDFVELALYRGDLPPEAAALYDGLTDAKHAESFALFGAIAERTGRVGEGVALSDAEIGRIAATIVDRITRHLGADAPRVLGSIDPGVARRAAELYLRLGDPAQRRLDSAITDALLDLIEKGGTS